MNHTIQVWSKTIPNEALFAAVNECNVNACAVIRDLYTTICENISAILWRLHSGLKCIFPLNFHCIVYGLIIIHV